MYFRTLVITLLVSAALAQASPQERSNLAAETPDLQHHDDDDAPPPASAAGVQPDSPVISIAGICDRSSNAPAARSGAAAGSPVTETGKEDNLGSRDGLNPECKTVVTKAQFEKLVHAFNPDMRAIARRHLAESYPRLLLFANKARELGLDKDPGFAEMMNFASMQLLTQRLNRYFEEQAGIVSDADVEKYYKENLIKFERADLARVFVPKQGHELQETGSGQPGPAMDSLTLAQRTRARAARGESIQQLQKEAFEAAGVPSESPNVRIGNIPATGLPVNHQIVFKLEPGQVSEVIADPSGYYIYKMIAKQTMPMNQVSKEIRKSISFQRVQDWSASLAKSVRSELNPTYFGSLPEKSQHPAQKSSQKAEASPAN